MAAHSKVWNYAELSDNPVSITMCCTSCRFEIFKVFYRNAIHKSCSFFCESFRILGTTFYEIPWYLYKTGFQIVRNGFLPVNAFMFLSSRASNVFFYHKHMTCWCNTLRAQNFTKYFLFNLVATVSRAGRLTINNQTCSDALQDNNSTESAQLSSIVVSGVSDITAWRCILNYWCTCMTNWYLHSDFL